VTQSKLRIPLAKRSQYSALFSNKDLISLSRVLAATATGHPKAFVSVNALPQIIDFVEGQSRQLTIDSILILKTRAARLSHRMGFDGIFDGIAILIYLNL
jgi:hypothetical protein